MSMLTLEKDWRSPDPAWRPVITEFERTMKLENTYKISGRQLNGLTQACSFGDDAQMATNYPLVRLTSTSSDRVIYLRTKNFSTMGIATGDAIHTFEVEVAPSIPIGEWQLEVVANGIASNPVVVNVIS